MTVLLKIKWWFWSITQWKHGAVIIVKPIYSNKILTVRSIVLMGEIDRKRVCISPQEWREMSGWGGFHVDHVNYVLSSNTLVSARNNYSFWTRQSTINAVFSLAPALFDITRWCLLRLKTISQKRWKKSNVRTCMGGTLYFLSGCQQHEDEGRWATFISRRSFLISELRFF